MHPQMTQMIRRCRRSHRLVDASADDTDGRRYEVSPPRVADPRVGVQDRRDLWRIGDGRAADDYRSQSFYQGSFGF
jgi:hypothetical protein